jgi:hypothetical protein
MLKLWRTGSVGVFVAMYTIGRGRCRTDFVRDIAYPRPWGSQLGGVRVYKAAREGPESVTKLP